MLRSSECFERASHHLSLSVQLRATAPRYEWSTELAQSLTAIGSLQRDMNVEPSLVADTCYFAYERYAATLGPYHHRTSNALNGLWRAYLDLGLCAHALSVAPSEHMTRLTAKPAARTY